MLEIGASRAWGLVCTLLAGYCWLLALPACSDEEHSPAWAGTWLGTLHIDARDTRVAINIEGDAAAGYTATVDIPDQGQYGIAVRSLEVVGRHVALTIVDMVAYFSGNLSDDEHSIEGTFVQGALSLPLTLDKQPGPLDRTRPQDPHPPFSYRTEDVTVHNERAEIDLGCTLTWPMGNGPFDVVVLITGSGPQNRDEELANHRPFAVIADALARADTAALRCDDRGFGESTGSFEDATMLEFVADTLARVEFLRSQDYFAVARIGLLGHSEGGAVAPLAANMDPRVDFLILLAGPGVPGDQILRSQQRAIGAASGASESDLDQNDALVARAIELVRTIDDPEALERELRALGTANGVDAAELEASVTQFKAPFLRFFLDYDPAPVLRQIDVPVLALNGSLDLQVLPDLNLPPIAAALQQGGNADATIRELPGLNHLFQHTETGRLDEYAVIEETIAPEVLSEIAAWIEARRAGSGVER